MAKGWAKVLLSLSALASWIPPASGGAEDPKRPGSWIPEDLAERLYSKQRFAYLDPGEEFLFRTKDGAERRIRLVSVREISDSVLDLARRAEVAVEVDGRRIELECGPYVLPTEIGGRDGDPAGQRFHHNYGVDFAGYERRERVASAIAGTVVRADRREGTLAVRDDRGVTIVYGHLDSILSGIREGSRVERGQWVGMLGRRGGSGNFSHLHVGIYLTDSERLEDRMNRNLNLYPWLVAAYRVSAGPELTAVARPHHTVCTGEKVIFDGSKSLPGKSRIAKYEWVFEDGSRALGPRAERGYERPGCYVAALWVEDAAGSRDVDFARVKVFSRSRREDAIPTLFATQWPTKGVRPGDPVNFRIWPQGGDPGPIEVDFGDGSSSKDYVPYSAIAHAFSRPGIYVVTVSAPFPATEKLKVIVEE